MLDHHHPGTDWGITGVMAKAPSAGRSLLAQTGGEFDAVSPVSPEQTAKPLLHLYVIGPMRLTDAAGRKIVIRGRKTMALLALVALGPQMQRSRAWLRDKLWSGSDDIRSATSLRQSLFELRRDLGPIADQVLDISANLVALHPVLVWVDQLALAGDATLFRKLNLSEPAFPN